MFSAEMTDQNFVEDDSEEEQASRTLSNKCRKISKATSSGNDQVRFTYTSAVI